MRYQSIVQIRLPESLLKRLDTYRLGMTLRPSRSQVIRFLLEHALNIAEAGEDDGQAVAAFHGENRRLTRNIVGGGDGEAVAAFREELRKYGPLT